MFNNNHTTNTTLVLQPCCIFTIVGHPSIHFKQKAYALAHKLTRTCCATSSNCNWNSSNMPPITYESFLDKCAFYLLPGVRSQLTAMPHNTCNQTALNRCPVSHLRRTYRVLHEHMFEERQKPQRNETARSLVANESSRSCPQTVHNTRYIT